MSLNFIKTERISINVRTVILEGFESAESLISSDVIVINHRLFRTCRQVRLFLRTRSKTHL